MSDRAESAAGSSEDLQPSKFAETGDLDVPAVRHRLAIEEALLRLDIAAQRRSRARAVTVLGLAIVSTAVAGLAFVLSSGTDLDALVPDLSVTLELLLGVLPALISGAASLVTFTSRRQRGTGQASEASRPAGLLAAEEQLRRHRMVLRAVNLSTTKAGE